jgi:hypothetical protein
MTADLPDFHCRFGFAPRLREKDGKSPVNRQGWEDSPLPSDRRSGMLRTISQPRMTKKMPRLVWEAAGAQVCVGKMGEVGFDCRRCGLTKL